MLGRERECKRALFPGHDFEQVAGETNSIACEILVTTERFEFFVYISMGETKLTA